MNPSIITSIQLANARRISVLCLVFLLLIISNKYAFFFTNQEEEIEEYKDVQKKPNQKKKKETLSLEAFQLSKILYGK